MLALDRVREQLRGQQRVGGGEVAVLDAAGLAALGRVLQSSHLVVAELERREPTGRRHAADAAVRLERVGATALELAARLADVLGEALDVSHVPLVPEMLGRRELALANVPRPLFGLAYEVFAALFELGKETGRDGSGHDGSDVGRDR